MTSQFQFKTATLQNNSFKNKGRFALSIRIHFWKILHKGGHSGYIAHCFHKRLVAVRKSLNFTFWRQWLQGSCIGCKVVLLKNLFYKFVWLRSLIIVLENAIRKPLSSKEGACILFFCHSHSHNNISNIYLLVLSKATG